MDLKQQLLYSIILRSTKSRFDYTAFQSGFAFNIDSILVELLEAFSAAKTEKQIVNEMHIAAFERGHHWIKPEIYKFIEDKSFIFRMEIATTSLLKDMIDMGLSQLHITNVVSQLCGNRKPLRLLQ